MDSSGVKEYFKEAGTISKWWEPEEKPGLFRTLYVEQREVLKELFNPYGKVILDAGTGKGRFAIDFAHAGAKDVFATDLSEDMLDIARKRAVERGVGEKIKFEVMDIEELHYQDNFFDVVCCMETFVHLPSPQIAMKELARVAKPGGMVVGSVTLPIKNWYVNATRISSFSQFFEWVFTPVYHSAAYQKAIRRVLRRHPAVGRSLPGDYFTSLFTNANLSIVKQILLGHPQSPRFLIIAASKPAT